MGMFAHLQQLIVILSNYTQNGLALLKLLAD